MVVAPSETAPLLPLAAHEGIELGQPTCTIVLCVYPQRCVDDELDVDSVDQAVLS